MSLLFDQNLSLALVRLLADLYASSAHVREVGLHEADDVTIWRYAAEHDLVIVSKDSDFHQMSLLYGHPPKVIWLRVGNSPTRAIEALIRTHTATIHAFQTDPDVAFLALG